MDWSAYQTELTEVAGLLGWEQITAIADRVAGILASHDGSMTAEEIDEAIDGIYSMDSNKSTAAEKRVRDYISIHGATVASLRLTIKDDRLCLANVTDERDTLSAEVERLKAKLTGADGRAKLLLDAKNHWAERARAAEAKLEAMHGTLLNGWIASDIHVVRKALEASPSWKTPGLRGMTEPAALRLFEFATRALSAEASQRALIAAGTEFQQRIQALEADRDGWMLVALRALVLNVMVRAQWERYMLAAGQPVDGCPGPGKCHGSMVWCDRCGDIGLLCDMHGRCDLHRDRWTEHVMEWAPVAKLAREEGYAAGRREAGAERLKEVEDLRTRLRRARTDAWREAVDVINGEPLASEEAVQAMASIAGRIVPKKSPCGCDAVFFEGRWMYHQSECPESFDSRRAREVAVAPFLALARAMLRRVSYEPITLDECRRLLAAFNAVPEEEQQHG